MVSISQLLSNLNNYKSISRAELQTVQKTLHEIESQQLINDMSCAGLISLSAIGSSYLTVYYVFLRESIPDTSEMLAAAASLGGSMALLVDRCYQILSPNSSSHQLAQKAKNISAAIQAILDQNPNKKAFDQTELTAIKALFISKHIHHTQTI